MPGVSTTKVHSDVYKHCELFVQSWLSFSFQVHVNLSFIEIRTE